MTEYTTLFTNKLQESSAIQFTLSSLIDGFTPISLKEMDSRALLDRIDTKYVMNSRQAMQTLGILQADYSILSIQGQRLNHYRTLYFDTPGFDLYNLHVNGQAERFKVRCREYVDTCTSFLEVKHRTRKDRTIKQRIATAQPLLWLTDQAESWLKSLVPVDSSTLEPKLLNAFTRITLVNKSLCERVTIDFALAFKRGRHTIQMGDLVIAEVKMDDAHYSSPFTEAMRDQKIRPDGFSKYCIGVSLLYDRVKKNSLKPRLIQLEKMTLGVL